MIEKRPTRSLFLFCSMKYYISICLLLLGYSCEVDKTTTEQKEEVVSRIETLNVQHFYDSVKFKGSFIAYSSHSSSFYTYNDEANDKEYTPASTFKILNSLIAIEEGVIADENEIIKWDGIRRNPVWNKDHDLKTAYQNSTVWFYQELARRVGEDKYQYWLDTCNYGNKNISGGVDLFWLTGELKISPMEQIEFLQQLEKENLPFSKRTYQIVKEIMLEKEQLPNQIRRSKTGWGTQGKTDIGWYIGFIEKENDTIYFANRLESDTTSFKSMEDFNRFNYSRKAICDSILNLLQSND